MEIVRKGECNNCGWCCQFIAIQRVTVPVRDVTPDSTKFYELRNGIVGNDGKLRVVQHAFVPCNAHDNVVKRCKDYDNRPQICSTFPSLPGQIEGTPCSYWFERTTPDGVTERRGGLGSPFPTPPIFE